MSTYDVVAAAGAITLVVIGLTIGLDAGPRVPAWLTPAILGVGFLTWSIGTVVAEGPTGFWDLHTAGAWGVQVWLDLLIAAGTAWYLLQPRLRELGIPRVPWFLAIAATGSLALLALLTLVLVRSRQSRDPALA